LADTVALARFTADPKEPEMTATTLARVRPIAARVRDTLAEMNYAQRRMAEIRMGLPFVEPAGRRCIDVTVGELEALYAYLEGRARDEYEHHRGAEHQCSDPQIRSRISESEH
jgi:hypothetical protein